MQIARTITIGDEDDPECQITVETNGDDIFLIVTDYQGSEESEPVRTAMCLLSRNDALTLARLINDAANDG